MPEDIYLLSFLISNHLSLFCVTMPLVVQYLELPVLTKLLLVVDHLIPVMIDDRLLAFLLFLLLPVFSLFSNTEGELTGSSCVSDMILQIIREIKVRSLTGDSYYFEVDLLQRELVYN